ncbi:hypothetical protein D6810_00890 [Candidatus Dojkabacteria bacterium]|uniref:DDH domain-containing protein n=1 Tax=Candidatus Dojkabacteria bacterium TaxID=2099670 RepID=A0A3M0YZ77_9BACT|nr:MAG: hypothetical protein D6810_00890 [Candidatus Dojkabacteria bacterium]
MTNPEIVKKVPAIVKKINEARKIMIISDSARPDWDCYGTALAIREWLIMKGKQVQNVTFNKIPEEFFSISEVGQIVPRYVEDVEWEYFDLVIGIDSSDFSRLVGPKYQVMIDRIGINRFVNIDHHQANNIEAIIPENTIRDESMVSTAQVFWEYFVKPENFQITVNMANLLYLAHCSDSNRFFHKNENDSLLFGHELIKSGANSEQINEFLQSSTLEEWKALAIFLKHINFWDDERTMVLYMRGELIGELEKNFGLQWQDKNLDEIVKNKLFNSVGEYDIGLIVWFNLSSEINKISYRVRGSANIDLPLILSELGFEVGGHKNAGGAKCQVTSKELESMLRPKLRELFQNKAY